MSSYFTGPGAPPAEDSNTHGDNEFTLVEVHRARTWAF
jgi:hypothetical protein